MNKAVFLDRDGVLLKLPAKNMAYGFVYKKKDLKIVPQTKNALQDLKELGFLRIVVTNQPVIARGIATYREVEDFHKSMNKNLSNLIDKFFICPHHPEMHDDVPNQAKKYRIKCDCRKPAPGMIIQAAKKLRVNLSQSWMIGDMISDILAGQRAGCRTILIKSECNNRMIRGESFDINTRPDFYANNIQGATKIIKTKQKAL